MNTNSHDFVKMVYGDNNVAIKELNLARQISIEKISIISNGNFYLCAELGMQIE